MIAHALHYATPSSQIKPNHSDWFLKYVSATCWTLFVFAHDLDRTPFAEVRMTTLEKHPLAGSMCIQNGLILQPTQLVCCTAAATQDLGPNCLCIKGLMCS